MKMFKKIFAFVLMLAAAACVFAEKTPVENLHKFELDNGLTLFARIH